MQEFLMPNQKQYENAYLTQKILTASPEQLIAYLFDAALAACVKQDRRQATKAIQELINALNFDYQDFAAGLFQLYRYSLNKIQKGEFQQAQEILSELKGTWVEAMKVI